MCGSRDRGVRFRDDPLAVGLVEATDWAIGGVAQLYGECEGEFRGGGAGWEWAQARGGRGEAREGGAEGGFEVGLVNSMHEGWIGIGDSCGDIDVRVGEGDVAVTFGDGGEGVQVEGPFLEDGVGGEVVDAEGDKGDGVLGKLCLDGRDGGVDPAADCWMTGLADREVVGTGGEERGWWVDVAEVEDLVDADCEERGEGREKGTVGGDEIGVGCGWSCGHGGMAAVDGGTDSGRSSWPSRKAQSRSQCVIDVL